jgi:hypothetical protein
MVSLLLQLHLTRANDPPVPLFLFARRAWEWIRMGVEVVGREGRVRREV